jgi:hypothetical protein
VLPVREVKVLELLTAKNTLTLVTFEPTDLIAWMISVSVTMACLPASSRYSSFWVAGS